MDTSFLKIGDLVMSKKLGRNARLQVGIIVEIDETDDQWMQGHYRIYGIDYNGEVSWLDDETVMRARNQYLKYRNNNM